eukprot:5281880-Ditylum_brightwellii.AAC.1
MAKINTVCASGTDKYGRWSFVMLKGKYKRKVTVITASKVCKNTLGTAGGNTCNNVALYGKKASKPLIPANSS